ncbi:hypothetical protein [Paraburkholderia hospita]|uniref:hypothetical protein n=1 Tax=Paraburkholderia hospita TaxID=169430 RepID=UPI003ECEEB9C
MTKVAIALGDYAGLHREVVSVVESARRTAARRASANDVVDATANYETNFNPTYFEP